MGRTIVTQRHEDGLEGNLGLQGCCALEGHEGHRMILGDGAQEGVHRVAVAIVPERRKGAALQFAAIAGAQVRAGEAERELVLPLEFQNEGIGQRFPNARGVDIATVRRAARATNRVPIGIEGLRARHLHRSGPHLESRAVLFQVPAATPTIAKCGPKSPLKE